MINIVEVGSASKRGPELPVLTPREGEIILWCARGLTRSTIAARMALSEHTIDFHLRNAAKKLGAPNCTAVVAKAIHLGLVSLGAEPPA